jgi:TolB protein
MRSTLVRTLLSASIVASVSCGDGPTERQPPVELAEIVFCRGSGGLCRMTAVNPDGSGAQTIAPLIAGDPAWSRDGKRIAFIGSQEGIPELAVWNNDQSIRRLTSGSRVELSPAWSPDGTRIVFAAGTLQKFELFVINADGAGEQQLTQGQGQAWRPDWSPDGRTIVFQANNEIAVMDAAGGEPKSIAVGEAPAWSPDGSRIAFSARPGDSEGRAIWTMAADGTDLKRVTTGPWDYEPDWSPDGRRIVFTRLQLQSMQLHVINVDGTGHAVVAADSSLNVSPSWRP